MGTLIERSIRAARKYTLVDYSCLKLTLLSLGILLGAYFSKFFLNNASLLWVIFIITYIWIMYRTFIKHMD
jgi:small multidrug resistance family-3 protein